MFEVRSATRSGTRVVEAHISGQDPDELNLKTIDSMLHASLASFLGGFKASNVPMQTCEKSEPTSRDASHRWSVGTIATSPTLSCVITAARSFPICLKKYQKRGLAISGSHDFCASARRCLYHGTCHLSRLALNPSELSVPCYPSSYLTSEGPQDGSAD